MRLQPIIRSLLPIYVALGPVYWFIGLQPGVFNLLKYAIAAAVIFTPLIISSHMFYLKVGVLKNSGAALILGIIFLSMPSVLVHQSTEGLAVISRYFILLGLLLGFYWALSYQFIYQHLATTMALVLTVICSITIADFLLGVTLYSYDGSMRLHKVGFSTTRTGWSSGLACCALFMTWQFIITKHKIRYLYMLAFAAIVFSQLASGGRGGLLASLVGATCLFLYYGKWHYVAIALLVAVIFVSFNQEMLTTHLRFNRLGDGGGDFTSGRADHYLLALEVINNPLDLFLGLGPHGYKAYFAVQSISNEIHNVWMRLLVEYGLFLPLFILAYVGYTIINFYFLNRRKKHSIGALFILIFGLIPTMVEPNAIVFSYQNYLIWWLIFVSVKMNTAQHFASR